MKNNKVVYDTRKITNLSVEEFKEAIRFRDVIKHMIRSGFITRYKRSFLGVFWSLLDPILQMSVLTIAFSVLFKQNIPNYPVFLFSGLVIWQFYTSASSKGMNSLVWGGNLLKSIYLPHSSIIISAIGEGLINLGFGFIPLFIIMLIFQHPFTLAILFLPVAILITAVFTLGVSLILGTIAVFFSDIIDLYRAILQAAFYLTPIMYPAEILPEFYQEYIFLNPFTNFIEIFRSPIYYGTLPDNIFIVFSILYAIGAVLLGWYLLSSKINEINYRL